LNLQQHQQQQPRHCLTPHYCCCCQLQHCHQLLPLSLALSWLALLLPALHSFWLPLRWQLLPLRRCGPRDLTWHLLLLLLQILLALTWLTLKTKPSQQKGWNVTMTCDSRHPGEKDTPQKQQGKEQLVSRVICEVVAHA
jgi:hypothetical protein